MAKLRDRRPRAARPEAAAGRTATGAPGGRATRRAVVAGVALAAAAAAAVLTVLWTARRGAPDAPEGAAAAAPAAVVPPAAAPAAAEIRNVVLITLDTTRWDVISAYGAPEVNSPAVGALARESVVFENAFAPIPNTLASHASMLTGKIPLAHGVFDNARYRLADGHQTLAEVLRAQGFATAAFVSALVLADRFGLARGFDVYDDDMPAAAFIGERRGDATTARALDWLERHAGGRNFLFLHLFDPHAPYEAPEPFASEIRRVYHKYPRFLQDYVGEVAFVDHCVGLVLAKLRQLGIYDRTLVCVAADHGESHGEHGEETHAYFIYTSTMRVPLVMKVPGVRGPLRVREAVEVTDIPTTVLSLLGLRFDGAVQGHDLSPLLRGDASAYPDRGIVGVSLEPRKYGGSALLGLVAGGWHYIQAPRPELYDLARDPYERQDLAAVEADTAARMRRRLDEILDRPEVRALPERLAIDADTRAQLEQLGYVVTGEPGAEPGEGALDPKDLLGYYKAALASMSYLVPESRPRALAAAEEMVTTRPGFYFGWLMKARILEASGRHADALAALEKARTLAPDSQPLTLDWSGDRHAVP